MDFKRKLKKVAELTILTKNTIMEHIKLPSEIENLYKNKKISSNEARELINNWSKLSKSERKKHLGKSSTVPSKTNLFKKILDFF